MTPENTGNALADTKGRGIRPSSVTTPLRPSADGAPSTWDGPSANLAGGDLGRAGSGSAHAVSTCLIVKERATDNYRPRDFYGVGRRCADPLYQRNAAPPLSYKSLKRFSTKPSTIDAWIEALLSSISSQISADPAAADLRYLHAIKGQTSKPPGRTVIC